MKSTKKLTLCTKLQSFQYRLLNDALVTNEHLFRWKVITNDSCTFCQKCTETVMHLLTECQVVAQKIWIPLKNWLNYFCYIDFVIVPYDIILNRYKDSFPALVNTILCITKQYIYATRCLGKDLQFQQLISKISQYRTLEYIVAKRNGLLTKHNAKWQIYDVV